MLLNNDEIEVACDALWSAKQWRAWDVAQERLWSRLQPLRSGDYGGSATTELEPEEQVALARALRCCTEQVELDEDEQRLLARVIGPNMTLADVIALVEQFDDDETIYAESTAPAARAAVAVEPIDGSTPNAAAGLSYLLEVATARETIAVWRAWRPQQTPSPADRFAAVIYYVEHDAWLPVD